MKYLFIILKIQDGEREHNHKCLHTTNAKNIQFAAQRYAASFWGFGKREKDYWWVNCEITIRLESVVEITLPVYNLLIQLFNGQTIENAYNQIQRINRAECYISESDEYTTEEIIKLAENHPDHDDLLADLDGVTVWEPIEDTLTIRQFLDSI